MCGKHANFQPEGHRSFRAQPIRSVTRPGHQGCTAERVRCSGLTCSQGNPSCTPKWVAWRHQAEDKTETWLSHTSAHATRRQTGGRPNERADAQARVITAASQRSAERAGQNLLVARFQWENWQVWKRYCSQEATLNGGRDHRRGSTARQGPPPAATPLRTANIFNSTVWC